MIILKNNYLLFKIHQIILYKNEYTYNL